MRKEKIFKTEDFEKYPKSRKKSSQVKWWILAFAGCVIGGCIWLYLSRKPSTPISDINYPPIQTVDSLSIGEQISKDKYVDSLNYYPAPVVIDSQKSLTNEISLNKDEENVLNNTSSLFQSKIESEALRVIRGDYGNNPVRRNMLGTNYQPIQDRVNQLKREGIF